MVEETPPKQEPQWRFWIRACLFVGTAAWLGLTPGCRKVFGPIESPLILRWTMFSSFGTDICDVRFYRPGAREGRFTEIDWRKRLRPESDWYDYNRMKISTMAEVELYGRRLCAKLDVQDVRAKVQCGGMSGWKKEGSFQTNLCSAQQRVQVGTTP